MRARTVTAVFAALLVTGSMGVAGCSTAERSATTAAPAAAGEPAAVPLTPDVARDAFEAHVAADDVARAAGDARLALTWSVNGQALLVAAEFREAAFTGDPLARYDYREPEFFVPKLTTYPQWFVVAAERTPRPAAGRAQRRTVLMAFTLKRPGHRWRLSLQTELRPKTKLPEVEVADDGFATPLPTFAEGLVIRPRDLAAIQTSIAEEGPEVEAAKVMKAGPSSTGLYDEGRKAEAKAKKDGLAYESVLVGTAHPLFALGTEDGGGLVLYSLSRETVTYLKNKKKGRLAIPRKAAHLLESMILGDELHLSETLQFAAYDPPRPKSGKPRPKADVIAADGGVVKAGSPKTKVP